MGKIITWKCEFCGDLFEKEYEYNNHIAQHKAINLINKKFPRVHQEGCEFTNGGFYVQRTKKWVEAFEREVIKETLKFEKKALKDANPNSYAWHRILDDYGSLFYCFSSRRLSFCRKCWKEWGQPYHANNCCKKHKEE